MTVSILGTDPRLRYCREYLLKRGGLPFSTVALAPIPTTVDGKTLKGTGEEISQATEFLGGSDALVCYGLPREIKMRLVPRGVAVADLAGDEEFLEENARLTAVGAVGRILTEEISAPSELSVGVIGYGRIGRRLVDFFAYLGAKIKVFTSKTELARELSMLGISGLDSLSPDSFSADAFSGLDILINTAPAMLVPPAARETLSKVRTIELASGVNFPDGITYERFAAIPAEMYPKSAGVVLAKSALKLFG